MVSFSPSRGLFTLIITTLVMGSLPSFYSTGSALPGGFILPQPPVIGTPGYITTVTVVLITLYVIFTFLNIPPGRTKKEESKS